MSKPLPPKAGYVHSLDGIRFFAVFMVLLKHVGLGASSAFAPLQVVGTMTKAGSGVPLFFVVSGYLITSILYETGDVPNRYRNFLARRSLRIFPLYFGYLALAALVTAIWAGHPVHRLWIFLLYLQNTLPYLASITQSSLPLYHLWTLGVQEQFYLVWPVAIWMCRSWQGVKKLCWAVVVLSLVVRIYVVFHYNAVLAEQLMPCRAGEMAFGGLFAMEAYGRSWLSAAGPRLLWFFSLLCAGMILLRMDEHPVGMMLLHEAIALFATALLASALNPHTLAARLLGTPFLAEIGRKYSYGLFVFHPPMIVVTDRVLHLRPHHVLDGMVRVVVTVTTSVLLAKLSYTFFERHFLHMKRLFPAERKRHIVPRGLEPLSDVQTVHSQEKGGLKRAS